MKQLLTRYKDHKEPGPFEFTAQFDSVRNIEIEGRQWPVSAISCMATQVHQKKRMWVKWNGDAFFDWHSKQLTIPAQGTVTGSFVPTDLESWPDFDGDIPEVDSRHEGLVRATLIASQVWNPAYDVDTPNLEDL